MSDKRYYFLLFHVAYIGSYIANDLFGDLLLLGLAVYSAYRVIRAIVKDIKDEENW